jgi:DNA primase
VAAPIGWDELAAGVRPGELVVGTVLDRLRTLVDPWKDYGAVRQSLTAPMKQRLGLR